MQKVPVLKQPMSVISSLLVPMLIFQKNSIQITLLEMITWDSRCESKNMEYAFSSKSWKSQYHEIMRNKNGKSCCIKMLNTKCKTKEHKNMFFLLTSPLYILKMPCDITGFFHIFTIARSG